MNRTSTGHVRRTFVCLSSQRWSDRMWTNKQHIMSRLGREHRVIYVDFGTRPLAGFAWRKLRRFDLAAARVSCQFPPAPIAEEHGGVTVLEFAAPRLAEYLPHGSRLRAVAEFDLRIYALGRWMRAQGIEDAIVWVYHPGYGGRVATLPAALVVYDCVDDYATFPEFRGAEAWIEGRERELCAVADLVFCTSRPLYEAKHRLAPGRTHLVPNVADAAHFERAADPLMSLPGDVAALPRPIVGFVGAVSGYKVELAWLAHLARRRPGWSVVLVGPRGVADPHTDVSALEALPNVHLLGYRAYETLPGYLKAFDAVVIPYRRCAATRGVFPIKFFESLASGRPVVISDLPSLSEYFQAVRVARDAEEFVTACDAAIAEGHDGAARERRMALARANTWESRISKLLDRIDGARTHGVGVTGKGTESL